MKEPPETEDKFSEEWRGLTLHCCRVAWLTVAKQTLLGHAPCNFRGGSA